jgi:hypothetical protein
MAFSRSRLDRSSHPIVVVEFSGVERAWANGPGQVSSGLRTSTLAIVIVEWIDDTTGGSCQTHVVLDYLAGEGQRIRIEKGGLVVCAEPR